MANSGWGSAPGTHDDVESMIAAVSDSHVRDTLSRMQADNRRFQDEHNRQFQSFSSILLSVAEDVRTLANKSSSAPPVVYPQFIAAADDSPTLHSLSASDSQASSFTPPSSLTDKAELGVGSGSVVVLRCLFCHHYHTIEKSHCQHYTRLRDRYVNSEHYSGRCIIPRNHWIFTNFATAGQSDVEVVQNFVQKYLSHLASSNDKNVDPQRAAKLCAWLETIPRS
jgi:hypothetical protein